MPAFAPKSAWKPPKGYPNVEVFTSPVEPDLFKAIERLLGYSNLPKEEWDAIRSLADDRSIVRKRADEGCCIVIWDRKQKSNLAIKMFIRVFSLKVKYLRNL